MVAYRGGAMSFNIICNFPAEKFLMHYVQYVLAFRGTRKHLCVICDIVLQDHGDPAEAEQLFHRALNAK